MKNNAELKSDRLLDAADALIDVLSASPGISLYECFSREGNAYQKRVLTQMSDEEIHQATQFLTRCGIIHCESRGISSSN